MLNLSLLVCSLLCLLINTHMCSSSYVDLIDPALRIQQFMYLLSHTQHFLILVTQKSLLEIQYHWGILLFLTNINPVSIDHSISPNLLHAYSNLWIEHSLFTAKQFRTIILMLMMTRRSQMRTSYLKGWFWWHLW